MANFARDTVRTILTQGVMIGASLLAGILTARVLGPDARGIFSLCLLVATTATLFGGFEIGQALVFWRGNKAAPDKDLAGAALIAPVVSTLLTLVAMALIWPLLSETLEVLSPDLLAIAIALIPVAMSSLAVRQVFRAFDRFDRFNALRVLNPVFRATAIGLTFLFFGSTVRDAVLAVWFAEALVLVVSLIVLLRHVRPDFRAGLRAIPGLFRFGAKVESASVLGYASVRVSLFAIAYYLGPEDIAFYAVADGLVQQLYGLPMIIGTVLLPKIALLSDDRGAEMTAVTHRVTVFMMLVLALILAATSSWLVIGLYGKEYVPAISVLVVLLAGVVFQAGSRVLSPYLIASDRVGFQVLIQALSLGLHVFLLVLWTPQFGIVGAAWATAAGIFLRWILYVLVFRMLSKVPTAQFAWIRVEDLRRMVQAARDEIRARTA